MKTLELFNAVEAKETNGNIFISQDGFIIDSKAIWAKKEILEYIKKEKLNGNDLNKTFHKSWSKIKNSSRFELLLEQIEHYISTYGSDFKDEIYIPNEILNLKDTPLKYRVIKSYTKEEFIQKSLDLLSSGIALKEETVDKVISLLTEDLNYVFTGDENIKNKEAIIKLADNFGIYPKAPVEFLRYIIYKTTDNTLIIKNKESIDSIKNSSYDPSKAFKDFGLTELSTIFNRFKPLFLAYKDKCPSVINKISKLSKKNHKPLIDNPLNLATQRLLTKDDIHWLENATIYSLFKTLVACYNRGVKKQDTFSYKIRNGKSWYNKKETNVSICLKNFKFIKEYIKSTVDLSNEKIYIPDDIKYALPTSEKMFVGNVPTGTKFIGKKLAVGIYWENGWGARDLDLSGNNIEGKVGWNSDYSQGNGKLMYSGDITNAPNGAVEYLYASNGLSSKTLVNVNVYYGDEQSGYKIIIGKGDSIDKDYMMNPGNLFVDIKTETVQKNNTVGLFLPEEENQSFVVLNFGAGGRHISTYSELELNAFIQEWSNPFSLNELLDTLGVEMTDKDNCTIDLSLDNLEKDTFINLFNL